MFRAAAQGDTKAGRQLLDVIARAESGRVATVMEILESATHYKEKNLKIFEKHEREGLDPPRFTRTRMTSLSMRLQARSKLTGR
jgi:hypothetical protein